MVAFPMIFLVMFPVMFPGPGHSDEASDEACDGASGGGVMFPVWLGVKSREIVTCDGANDEDRREAHFVSMTLFRPVGPGLRRVPHSSWRAFDGGRIRAPAGCRSAGP